MAPIEKGKGKDIRGLEL